jgi:dolichol-phosphate mannosyltransferase
MNDKVVLIPTFNEADSICLVIEELKSLDVDIFVIDDDSPDETARIVKELQLDNVFVINHGLKNGIGPAYVTGLKIALEKGYSKIATMDADGSHQVADLARMFNVSDSSDVVMGTRWMNGGSVSNWKTHRIFISKFGTWFASRTLALPYKDLTGGLRVYDAKAIKRINLEAISSNGYCFQIEMIRAISTIEVPITEVPIHFIERQNGTSKMSKYIVLEAFVRVSLWGLQRISKYNADKLHYVK